MGFKTQVALWFLVFFLVGVVVGVIATVSMLSPTMIPLYGILIT